MLRRLPTEGERVLMGPGENAGAVSVGDGWAVAFKVESHNPERRGAVPGRRDRRRGILCSRSARAPIAVLDSLRWLLDFERSRYLFDHVVAGIGHYGNSIGVPTVGGEVYFEAPHTQLPRQRDVSARPPATGRFARHWPGNADRSWAPHGRLHGPRRAARSVLSPAELERGDEKRPSVQIGDPFEEAKLLECCLELVGRGLLVALQDLGAAGLTSSAGEMAEKGASGSTLTSHAALLREADMEPFEIMVSESQERMLAVVEPARATRCSSSAGAGRPGRR